jgi:hypothetical protein
MFLSNYSVQLQCLQRAPGRRLTDRDRGSYPGHLRGRQRRWPLSKPLRIVSRSININYFTFYIQENILFKTGYPIKVLKNLLVFLPSASQQRWRRRPGYVLFLPSFLTKFCQYFDKFWHCVTQIKWNIKWQPKAQYKLILISLVAGHVINVFHNYNDAPRNCPSYNGNAKS